MIEGRAPIKQSSDAARVHFFCESIAKSTLVLSNLRTRQFLHENDSASVHASVTKKVAYTI